MTLLRTPGNHPHINSLDISTKFIFPLTQEAVEHIVSLETNREEFRRPFKFTDKNDPWNLYNDLPTLKSEGSWLLISARLFIKGPPLSIVMLINMHLGTCDALEIYWRPIKHGVSAFLDKYLLDLHPMRLYFNGNRLISATALLSWANSNNVSVINHPLYQCSEEFFTAMISFRAHMEHLEAGTLSDFCGTVETWRLMFNERQLRRCSGPNESPAMGRGANSPLFD